jgi:2-polyprenyl-6-hydroxyphenyl methylase/3-demethylubiquinone-9 3-methyltransferase
MTNKKQFDFGQNWDEFSKNALKQKNIEQAIEGFSRLISNSELENKTFIDIGFGQGLSLLLATKLGATTIGVDINPKCKKVLEYNRNLFPEIKDTEIKVIVGSILDNAVIEEIKTVQSRYDIVHSWGVLHHTGDMWKAIEVCSSLVNTNGKLIIAIYNKHWSSKFWWFIKLIYNYSPKLIRKMMIYFFYLIIIIAKFFVTFRNPLKNQRGMNFYYNVIDWVGGYPYQYASENEIIEFLKKKGFKLLKFFKSQVPTGCYEYVFEIRKD